MGTLTFESSDMSLELQPTIRPWRQGEGGDVNLRCPKKYQTTPSGCGRTVAKVRMMYASVEMSAGTRPTQPTTRTYTHVGAAPR